ncbi:hypothetical protein [Cryobacterium arcticum]|uniref:Uncharacterized protein n=1 Tax=Cryobacterium arcticum TaxID=670052 RepID=A0A1B1BPB7_9MICO|nr:hypothetical protein [Cryobacterium arcticum]ANP74492.1 hypothetical protein PA27867_3570 [Cryobacterium arcticum]
MKHPDPATPRERAQALGVGIIYRKLTDAASIWLADFDTIVVHDGLTPDDEEAAIAAALEYA